MPLGKRNTAVFFSKILHWSSIWQSAQKGLYKYCCLPPHLHKGYAQSNEKVTNTERKKSQSNGKKTFALEEEFKKKNIWHMTAVIRSVKKHHFFCKLRFNQLVQCTSSLRIQQWLHCKMLTLSHCFHTFEPMPYKQSPRDGYLHLEQKGHQFQDTYRENFLQKAIFYTLELPELFLKIAI